MKWKRPNAFRRSFLFVLLILLWLSSFASGLKRSTIPPLIGFRINNGDRYTNITAIDVEIKSLKLTDSLIAEMKIGVDPALENSPWIKYTSEKIKLNLPSGDGVKYVYARLKDIAGNISPIESTSIILDTQPPQHVLLGINKDEKFTNDEKGRVVVFINSADKDLGRMIFGNRKDLTDGHWENFANTKKWILDLTGGDGPKIVYARFKDQAGNESDTFADTIILDTKPPLNGSVVINNDDKFTRDRKITLHIHADDASVVRIVTPGKSEIYPYTTEKDKNYMEVNWTLDSVEGLKVVRVYFMDEAKNRTTDIIQDEITLDRTGPPSPYISINGDSRYTNNAEGKVELRFTTRVNPETIHMRVSNYMDFHDTGPQSFKDRISGWQLLSEEDGMKTVYSDYIDEAGNHSDIGMAKIVLDRKPPKINKIYINDGGSWVISPRVTINMDVEEASHMQISNAPTLSNMVIWETFSSKKVDWPLIPGDGEKVIYCRFKDAAENITEIVTTNITLDTKPPTGELSIDHGSKFTNNPDKLVTLEISTDDGKGIQITNKPDFNAIKLEPFKNIIDNWQLDGEDGMKTVYIRLRDEAGNFSNVITASIILDRAPPAETSIVINEGLNWLRNPSRKAPVQLNAKGASHFMLSEDRNFNNVSWDAYKNVTSWIFSEGEGRKILYARYKDPANNISQIVSDSIQLDYTPPTCEEFKIDDGSEFTNNTQKKVTLHIKSPDAVKMTISNNPISDPTSATAWENYTATKEWILDGEDGLKTIYLVLKDEAGNYSGRYSERIILDRIPPANCRVTINDSLKYVPQGGRKIPVRLMADGADKVMVSEDADFMEARWEMFVPKIVYEVSKGDGIKNIFVKFRDKALNETRTFSGSVILDTTPPDPISVTINDGNKYTNDPSKKVNLKIEAKEASEMRIIQKGQPAGNWEPYVSGKTYTLMGDDGEKELGIFFRDEAGNITEPLVATIILDRIPPKPESIIIDDGRGWTNNKDKQITLNIKASGASEMMIGTDPNFANASWQAYNSKIENYVLSGEDGEKTIFIRFKDDSGNISSAISAKVNLKRTF